MISIQRIRREPVPSPSPATVAGRELVPGSQLVEDPDTGELVPIMVLPKAPVDPTCRAKALCDEDMRGDHPRLRLLMQTDRQLPPKRAGDSRAITERRAPEETPLQIATRERMAMEGYAIEQAARADKESSTRTLRDRPAPATELARMTLGVGSGHHVSSEQQRLRVETVGDSEQRHDARERVGRLKEEPQWHSVATSEPRDGRNAPGVANYRGSTQIACREAADGMKDSQPQVERGPLPASGEAVSAAPRTARQAERAPRVLPKAVSRPAQPAQTHEAPAVRRPQREQVSARVATASTMSRSVALGEGAPDLRRTQQQPQRTSTGAVAARVPVSQQRARVYRSNRQRQQKTSSSQSARRPRISATIAAPNPRRRRPTASSRRSRAIAPPVVVAPASAPNARLVRQVANQYRRGRRNRFVPGVAPTETTQARPTQQKPSGGRGSRAELATQVAHAHAPTIRSTTAIASRRQEHAELLRAPVVAVPVLHRAKESALVQSQHGLERPVDARPNAVASTVVHERGREGSAGDARPSDAHNHTQARAAVPAQPIASTMRSTAHGASRQATAERREHAAPGMLTRPLGDAEMYGQRQSVAQIQPSEDSRLGRAMPPVSTSSVRDDVARLRAMLKRH